MHCVVGSGPAGVACAQALLDNGAVVRMLDVGLTLEPSRAEVVRRLRSMSAQAWTPELLGVIKENTAPSTRGISTKAAFGSDFPYREPEGAACRRRDVGLRPSMAFGGLSNVWGAAVLPFRQSDLGGWPLGCADLARHYAAALRMTGLAARRDGLESLFPLYVDEPGVLEPSRQAAALLARLERHRAWLEARGIYFGASRLAVRAPRSSEDQGCVYCSTCMYGCPYGFIYNSACTVEELKAHHRFSYQPDVVVTSVIERPQSVVVSGRHRVTAQAVEVEAERVYLATGPVRTTEILLRSLKAYDHTVWLSDSQYFVVPLLLLRRETAVRREALHTLSQVFVEIVDPSVSPHTVHLQVYSYNDMITLALKRALGRIGSDALVRWLEDRLLVVQGYLHSSVSSRIGVTLRREGDGEPSLDLKADVNPTSGRAVRRVVAKLMRHPGRLGVVPVGPLLQIADPGRGFHSGGSFPMRSRPAPFETDALGRPHGWRRVHAVDATIFPSIPATTITYSVMANAHRIATAAGA